MEPRFLLLSDVAAELNVSDSQVYHMVRSGELPAIKIGGRGQWRVERARLEEYIQRKYAETADGCRQPAGRPRPRVATGPPTPFRFPGRRAPHCPAPARHGPGPGHGMGPARPGTAYRQKRQFRRPGRPVYFCRLDGIDGGRPSHHK